jgi:putative hydrolase of HD superfamily
LTDRLDAQFAFLNEADRLKSVLRATTLVDGSRLRANILGTSRFMRWCWPIRPARRVDRPGDPDAADPRSGGNRRGRRADPFAERPGAWQRRHKPPKRKPPTASSAFCPKICATTFALWEEFEAAETPDARFAKSLDRVQPVMANLMSGGGTWTTYNVTFDQLETRVGVKIAKGAPGLWDGSKPAAAARSFLTAALRSRTVPHRWPAKTPIRADERPATFGIQSHTALPMAPFSAMHRNQIPQEAPCRRSR